jgi:hypothetical protein
MHVSARIVAGPLPLAVGFDAVELIKPWKVVS